MRHLRVWNFNWEFRIHCFTLTIGYEISAHLLGIAHDVCLVNFHTSHMTDVNVKFFLAICDYNTCLSVNFDLPCVIIFAFHFLRHFTLHLVVSVYGASLLWEIAVNNDNMCLVWNFTSCNGHCMWYLLHTSTTSVNFHTKWIIDSKNVVWSLQGVSSSSG